MRLKSVLAAALALAGLAVFASPEPAAANGVRERPHVKKVRHVKHRVHHHRHAYWYKPDPYAWRYEPRGYYPYYNSGYWGSAAYVKWRNRAHLNAWIDQSCWCYHKAWGYPKPHYHHRAWHYAHHGRHRPWHW